MCLCYELGYTLVVELRYSIVQKTNVMLSTLCLFQPMCEGPQACQCQECLFWELQPSAPRKENFGVPASEMHINGDEFGRCYKEQGTKMKRPTKGSAEWRESGVIGDQKEMKLAHEIWEGREAVKRTCRLGMERGTKRRGALLQ